MRIFLTLMLTLVALAGCMDDQPVDPIRNDPNPISTTTTTTTTTTTSSASSTSSSSNEEPNEAPVIGSFSALTGANGSRNVTFTFNASDADGDPLQWVLDADGDGTIDLEGDTFPGNETFTFTAFGNYTATLVVTDGKDSVNATVSFQIAEASGPQLPLTFTFTGSMSGCLGADCADGGPTTHDFDVPAGATRIQVSLTWGPPGSDLDLYLNDPSGTEIANSEEGNTPLLGVEGEAIDVTISDAGTYQIVVFPFTVLTADYEAVVTVS